MKNDFKIFCWCCLFVTGIFFYAPLMAQSDTIPIQRTHPDKEKIWEKVLSNFKKDTLADEDKINILRRIDRAYLPFSGLIIRNIKVERLPFGTPIQDTSNSFSSTLTRWANTLHHLTSEKTIRNNLFFEESDTLKPFLMADNERYLRELPYLHDASIRVQQLENSDSADIVVIVKDLFSLGGAIGSLGLDRSDIQMREDNFRGTGSGGVLYGLYDRNREKNFAFGGEIVRRNMGGSFMDLKLGYRSYYSSLIAPKQENYYYANLNKPLLNRYMRWTYEMDASYHATRNRYLKDSAYYSAFHYSYYNFEGWAGYNINTTDFGRSEESKRLRALIGLRAIDRKFLITPDKYDSLYNWQFTDQAGLLTTLTFYRQNFYKAQYVYGFGRSEDIPEGLLLGLTGGFIVKQGVSRPFLGINFQHYGVNKKKSSFLSYTLRAEGYWDKNKFEDINLLGGISYFDRLKPIGTRWTQRFFLSLDAAKQMNSRFNEPLFLQSKFALPEFGRNYTGGDLRATAKAETVFFSPWSLAGFRFAPILFGNLSLFRPYGAEASFYSSFGAGIRTRNESLIFGTIELKGFFFPGGNFYNNKFGIELSSNVIFKYKSTFLQKPDFIEVN